MEKNYTKARVDQLIASHGYFEVATKNNSILINWLQTQNYFNSIEEKDGKIIAFLSKEVAAEDLNKELINLGIYLSHLVKKKESLETQFLQLTNNK